MALRRLPFHLSRSGWETDASMLGVSRKNCANGGRGSARDGSARGYASTGETALDSRLLDVCLNNDFRVQPTADHRRAAQLRKKENDTP